MNFEVKKTILNKIKEYPRIILFRHIRPDGDIGWNAKYVIGNVRVAARAARQIFVPDAHGVGHQMPHGHTLLVLGDGQELADGIIGGKHPPIHGEQCKRRGRHDLGDRCHVE